MGIVAIKRWKLEGNGNCKKVVAVKKWFPRSGGRLCSLSRSMKVQNGQILNNLFPPMSCESL